MPKVCTDPVHPLTLHADEIAHYHAHGYLVLPNVVRTDALPALRDEVLTVLERQMGIDRTKLMQGTAGTDKLRQCSTYLAGSQLDALINSPAMQHLAAQFIGGPAIRYMPFTAVKDAKGGDAFSMHQDNNYTCHKPALGSINIWVALVDMIPENGCLRIAPASHLHGDRASENQADGHRKVHDKLPALPIRMRAGDAVAFTRLTVHGSGANSTAEPRLAYALQYHREDVEYYVPETDEWRLLRTDPRWSTDPVAAFGVPS